MTNNYNNNSDAFLCLHWLGEHRSLRSSVNSTEEKARQYVLGLKASSVTKKSRGSQIWVGPNETPKKHIRVRTPFQIISLDLQTASISQQKLSDSQIPIISQLKN